MQHFPQYLATRAGTVLDRKHHNLEPPKWRLPQPPAPQQTDASSKEAASSESELKQSLQSLTLSLKEHVSVPSPQRQISENMHANPNPPVMSKTQFRESEMATIRTTAPPPPPASRMTVRTGLLGGGPNKHFSDTARASESAISPPPKSLHEHLQTSQKQSTLNEAKNVVHNVSEPRVQVQRQQKPKPPTTVIRPESPTSYSSMYRGRVDNDSSIGDATQATYSSQSTYQTMASQSTAGTQQTSNRRKGEKIELGGACASDAEKIRAKFERKTEKLRLENEVYRTILLQ